MILVMIGKAQITRWNGDFSPFLVLIKRVPIVADSQWSVSSTERTWFKRSPAAAANSRCEVPLKAPVAPHFRGHRPGAEQACPAAVQPRPFGRRPSPSGQRDSIEMALAQWKLKPHELDGRTKLQHRQGRLKAQSASFWWKLSLNAYLSTRLVK
jgi:hypothetical protein